MAEKQLRNPVFAAARGISGGVSEVIGMHTGPRFSPRRAPPIPAAFAMMRNPAIRDGRTSADNIGFYGTSPRLEPIIQRHTRPQVTSRGNVPLDPAVWSTSSGIIGARPKLEATTQDKTARMHYEANYARTTIGNRAFAGSSGTAARDLADTDYIPTAAEMAAKDKDGKVFGRDQLQTMGSQDSWRERAAFLSKEATASDNILASLASADDSVKTDTARLDGSRMASERFDSTYSNAHVTKDTMSALQSGCLPNIDPRRALTRPKTLAYGSSMAGQPEHLVRTPYGPRRVLPSRSFMVLSSTLDF